MTKLTPRAYEQIGCDLYGAQWAEFLARTLDVPPKQIRGCAQGGAEIPRRIELAVRWLAGHPERARALGRPPRAEALT